MSDARGDGKSLTRQEFEAVMRRATELALTDSDSSSELSEAELYRIAREVGISDRHVRLALSQVRSGDAEAGALDRWFGPEIVTASRVVPGTPRPLAERIDRFMVGGRLLQPVRRGSNILQYRPAVDWMSQVARVASATSRRYYVASAKSVEVHLEEVETARTLVEFRVDPGTRSEAVWGAFLGGGSLGAAGGAAAAFALTMVAPIAAAAAAGVVVGGSVTSGVVWSGARSHQKKISEVHAEVEGILDHLELDEPLEPPPSSWQQWVRRQFHGARKVFNDLDSGLGRDDFKF